MARTRELHSVDENVIADNALGSPEKAVFAKMLNRLINEKGVHQEELAKAVGVSTGSISEYRNGKKEPRLTIIVKLADFLGVDCHYLLTGVQAENYIGAKDLGLSDGAIQRLINTKLRAESERRAGWASSIQEKELCAINAILEYDYSVLYYIYNYLFRKYDAFAMLDKAEDGTEKDVIDKEVLLCVNENPNDGTYIRANEMQEIFLLKIQLAIRQLKSILSAAKGGERDGKH